MRSSGLFLSAFLFLLSACSDDDPAVCSGNVQPNSLPLFSPCVGDMGGDNDVCEGGTCANGYCSAACDVDLDCEVWEGFKGVCSTDAASDGYCNYLCVPDPDSSAAADATCPKVDDIQLECHSITCHAPYPCGDS